MKFDRDFADLFEVRGSHRSRRGEHWEPEVNRDSVTLSYGGFDDAVRRSCLRCTPVPSHISAHGCEFNLLLQPKDEIVLELVVSCLYESSLGRTDTFTTALDAVAMDMRTGGASEEGYIHTSTHQFNEYHTRSAVHTRRRTV